MFIEHIKRNIIDNKYYIQFEYDPIEYTVEEGPIYKELIRAWNNNQEIKGYIRSKDFEIIGLVDDFTLEYEETIGEAL